MSIGRVWKEIWVDEVWGPVWAPYVPPQTPIGIVWGPVWKSSAWSAVWTQIEQIPFDLEADPIALAATVATSGDPASDVTWDVEQPVMAGEMAGVLVVSGDVEFSTSGNLDIEATSAVAMSGVTGVSGPIAFGISHALVFSSPLAVAATTAVSGNVAPSTVGSIDIVASAITVSAEVSVSGNIATSFALDIEASPIGLSVETLVSGDPQAFGSELIDLEATPILMDATVDVSGDPAVSTEPTLYISSLHVERPPQVVITGLGAGPSNIVDLVASPVSMSVALGVIWGTPEGDEVSKEWGKRLKAASEKSQEEEDTLAFRIREDREIREILTALFALEEIF